MLIIFGIILLIYGIFEYKYFKKNKDSLYKDFQKFEGFPYSYYTNILIFSGALFFGVLFIVIFFVKLFES
jgi:hypothetical protein